MSKTKTMLAMLALGATVAFAGPAFAEKMKATLDGNCLLYTSDAADE